MSFGVARLRIELGNLVRFQLRVGPFHGNNYPAVDYFSGGWVWRQSAGRMRFGKATSPAARVGSRSPAELSASFLSRGRPALSARTAARVLKSCWLRHMRPVTRWLSPT